MPLFLVTIAREELEFVVEADDDAQVRAACNNDDFNKWGADNSWCIESISPVKQECKPEITVTDSKFGEWQGE